MTQEVQPLQFATVNWCVPSAGGLCSDSEGCSRLRHCSGRCCRYMILGVYDPSNVSLHWWILTVTGLPLTGSLHINDMPMLRYKSLNISQPECLSVMPRYVNSDRQTTNNCPSQQTTQCS